MIGNDPSCVSDAARMAGQVYIVTHRAKLLWVRAVENVATIKQIVRIINNEKSNLNMHVHVRYMTRYIRDVGVTIVTPMSQVCLY